MSWAPEGNIKGPPGITSFTRQGVTPLVNGQSFIAVTFLAAMADNSWVFGGCQVLNTVDASALNIVVGTLTAKSATGFTIQLSGAPDSSNYFLQWAVAGAPTGGGATTYGLTGPTSGVTGIASGSFMVALPVGTTVAAPVTITPHDGGAGGTFAPTTILLTTAAPSGAFTYTPASTGTKTISCTNNGALTDPASLSYVSVAYTYTLTGPTTGTVSVASTNFTVALAAGVTVSGTVTITPHDAGTGAAGTFTPSTVGLTNAAPSATFTYTPASTGIKTISTTNSGTLTDPASLSYNSVVHLLNALISYWRMETIPLGAVPDEMGLNPLAQSNTVPIVVGKVGNAASFNNPTANNFLRAPTSSSLAPAGDFTWQMWVNVDPAMASNFLMAKYDGTTFQYFFYHDTTTANGIIFGATNTSGAPAISHVPLTPSTWTHLVGWYDSSTQKVSLRVNDSVTYTGATAAAFAAVTTELEVGGNGSSAGTVKGMIDELGFWGRKLTAGEITALYNGGAGLPFSSFTA
jgi:hypothetical protein